jgi:hypothetical protein
MQSIRFEPKIRLTDIVGYSLRYDHASDNKVERLIQPIQERGWIVKNELEIVCQWKTQRTQKAVSSNNEDLVIEATRLAFLAEDERLKIYILTVLYGVSMPTASGLLHWFDKGRYPIIDFRALWSLGIPESQAYSLEFWTQYVAFTRQLADQAGVSMRSLDRALWQFSKENQPR